MKNPSTTAYRNMAGWDRLLRLLLGLAMLAVGAAGVAPGLASLALLIFAWVPLLTAISGWCPFYSLLGIRTHCSTPSHDGRH
ncbi:MAG TPA: DUF2892 domain-containing protein [Thermoanaerobaculia bacterium]|nr:DUF2892 domain-containing protein [Thermoanaerobaculia bacterium]